MTFQFPVTLPQKHPNLQTKRLLVRKYGLLLRNEMPSFLLPLGCSNMRSYLRLDKRFGILSHLISGYINMMRRLSLRSSDISRDSAIQAPRLRLSNSEVFVHFAVPHPDAPPASRTSRALAPSPSPSLSPRRLPLPTPGYAGIARAKCNKRMLLCLIGCL